MSCQANVQLLLKRLKCHHVWGHPDRQPEADHCHNHHEIVCVNQGPYTVTMGSETWTGHSGDAFYYPAQCAHRPAWDRSRLSRLFILEWLGGPNLLGPKPRRLFGPKRHLLLLLDWMAGLNAPEGEPPPPLQEALWLAVMRLFDYTPPTEQGGQAAVAERVLSLIRELYPYTLSLGDLARHADLSPSQLSRIFRKATGRSPMQALRNERAHQVAHLLATSNLSMEDIAHRCGLANASHLSHLFKAEWGESPSVFRQRARECQNGPLCHT